ncbi:MAG: hypothetical protein LJE61_00755 [Thiocapsa sp.]|nr:hypothetical protein [Thiocapsa sp.]MCG6898180.1 hypothetical protein [Thiocapsa sp.]MCG6983719.1 hypothetical protein [Thiocapsa sp.]
MTTTAERGPVRQGRRRALGLITGLGALGLAIPWPRRPSQARPVQRLPSLREADYYRPHELAG